MSKKNYDKRLFVFESWSNRIKLPKPVENIASMKVRWLSYETQSTGAYVLKASMRHIQSNGLQMLNDGSTDDYFYSCALDSRANVGHVNENYTDEHDVYFDNVIPKLHQFDIEFKVNNQPALDITPSNPLVMEIGFYHPGSQILNASK